MGLFSVPKRHTIVAYVSGGLVSAAWWLWIDANVTNQNTNQSIDVTFWHYLPLIFSTICLILMNVPKSADLSGDSFDEGMASKARFLIFAGFLLGLCCIIAALWIAIQNWFLSGEESSAYAPVILILSNIMIFIGALMLRFSKKGEEDEF